MKDSIDSIVEKRIRGKKEKRRERGGCVSVLQYSRTQKDTASTLHAHIYTHIYTYIHTYTHLPYTPLAEKRRRERSLRMQATSWVTTVTGKILDVTRRSEGERGRGEGGEK